MTYLSGRTNKKRVYTKYALYISVFLIVVFFWPFVQKHIYAFLEPAVIRVGVSKNSLLVFPEFFNTYVTSHKKLVAEQKQLQATIETLHNKVAEQDMLLRESSLYDTLIDASSTGIGNKPILMYPLMQDITSMYSSIVLSKGFKDGIIVGDTVYVSGRQAVCTIEEVYNSTSRCRLFTSANVTTEGVTSSSSITLSLVGRGGHFLANIVRDTPVTEGETVYLRSNPKIKLGKVQSVLQNDQDTSWHVFVESGYSPVTSSIFYVQH